MLRYTIELKPQAGTFLVDFELNAQDELLLRLPAWLPGSYMIRDMAAEIQSLEIVCGQEKLPDTKIDKSTWRVFIGEQSKSIHVRYEVFAQDTSVRRAYLDNERAFLTFSSLCLYPVGREEEPIELKIKKPADHPDWAVATALQPVRSNSQTFGIYRAADYDELIDSPMEIGLWQCIEFKAYGVPHRIILSGKVPPFDRTRLREDVKKCVETVIAFFEPQSHQAPFSSYMFFLNLAENLYGGLEHRNSCALVASFYDLPLAGNKNGSKNYARLLELFTHEYFHAWWVKRVKPAVFIPYDLTSETYTDLLWVFEGFTSYYDALLTARSQAVDADTYLKSLAATLNRHLGGTAKKRQSLAQSSYEAWTKYYKVRTNRSRSVTSYYDKGALVALALNARIIEKTRGKKSLDDVLRFAWEQYKEAGDDYAGLDEEVIAELIYDATGVDVSKELDRWVYGLEEPDYKKALKTLGISCECKDSDKPEQCILGAKLTGSDQLTVTQLEEDGAAEKAGVCVGDELVALDAIKIRKNNLDQLLSRYRDQKCVDLHVFRNGLLKKLSLNPKKDPILQYELRWRAKVRL